MIVLKWAALLILWLILAVGYVYITSALNAIIVGHMFNEDSLKGIANFGGAIIDPMYFVYPKGGSYTIYANVTCVNLDNSIMSKLKKYPL